MAYKNPGHVWTYRHKIPGHVWTDRQKNPEQEKSKTGMKKKKKERRKVGI